MCAESKSNKKGNMSYNDKIKVRKSWPVNPATKVHKSNKDISKSRRSEKEALRDEVDSYLYGDEEDDNILE